MDRNIEDKLLNPRPGSKVAAAKEFGIDLTLLLVNLRLTPEQRLEKLQEAVDGLEELRTSAKKTRTTRSDKIS
jgi:hypothetical protein